MPPVLLGSAGVTQEQDFLALTDPHGTLNSLIKVFELITLQGRGVSCWRN